LAFDIYLLIVIGLFSVRAKNDAELVKLDAAIVEAREKFGEVEVFDRQTAKAQFFARIGDMVRIDNFDGRITDIRTRYTLIRALNGREAIVPNEMLITQRVENSSLAELSVLVTTNVQVAYGTDVRALKPQLEAAVAQVTRVLADPPPAVHLLAFGDNGMDLAVNFWITDPENGQGNVRSEVNFAVLKVLNEQGIEIPYPQRVLHTLPARTTAS